MRQLTSSLALSTTMLSLALMGCTGGDQTAGPDAPVIRIEPDDPGTLDRLQAEVQSPDSSYVYQYSWYRDGEHIEHLQGSTVPSSLTAKGEVWQVRVVAYSGRHQGSEGSVETEILNTPPSVAAEWLNPSPGLTDDLTVVATPFDPDDDPVTLRFVWSVNGVEIDNDSDTVPASETDADQSWTVRIYPHDGEAEGEPAELSLAISNTAPVVGSVTLEPDPAFTDTDLTATAHDVFDAEGDPVTLTYDFYVGGTQVQSGSESTLSSSSFVKGNEVYVSITPFDGMSHGTPVASPTLTISNTPPELASASVSPRPLFGTDDATCTGEGVFDRDGDDVSLLTTWFIDGEESFSGEVLPSEAFVRGNSIACSITPFDGEDEGEPVLSDPIFVENSPPIILGGSISPSSPFVTSTITSSVSVTDADDDPISITYRWTVNGSLAPVDSSTFEIRPFASKHDVIALEIVATDGIDTTEPVSLGSVTVLNTLPTAPEIEISPSSPTEDDLLLCEIVTESFDADDDPLTYTFSWTVNGSPFTATDSTFFEGDSVRASATSLDDEWECTVVVSDGDGESPPATDSVILTRWDGLRRFTSCSNSGAFGPSESQCASSYADTLLAGEVSVSEGVQQWIVPTDGTYSFVVVGAHGAASSGATNERGGRGAVVRARRDLSAGDVVYVLIGQGGSYSTAHGGGGGASFVSINSRSDDGNLLVAGGGGGTRTSASSNGGDASTEWWGLSSGPEYFSGTAEAIYNNTEPHGFQSSGDPPPNGSSSDAWTDIGLGGLGAQSCYGDGGAGWFGDGHRDSQPTERAQRLRGSATGGAAIDASDGGFGGGGAGQGCNGGGGGGGYTGGNGGFIAGGGGSYSRGFSSVSVEIDSDRSYDRGGSPVHGYVTIDLVD